MGVLMEESVEEKITWAYVVGGYPHPDRYRAVCTRLQKLGINVTGAYREVGNVSVPKNATVVLVISDLVSHPDAAAARAQADKAGIPCIVGAYRNWANFEARLTGLGLGNLQLVAGGSAVISDKPVEKPGFHATIGERLAARQRDVAAELRDVKREETLAKVKGRGQKMPVNARAKAAADAAREALRKIFEKNKERLDTYTNVEAASDLDKETGIRLTPGRVSDYRNKMGYAQTPKGFKRPRAEKAPTPRGPAPLGAVGGSGAEAEFDQIQSILAAWAAKHGVSKCYVALDSGSWDANWEQSVVVTKERKYK